MAYFRAVARYALVLAITLGLFGVWLLGAALLFRHRDRRIRLRRWVLRRWGRITLAVLGVHVERSGKPPRPPFVLVANHLGYLDIPLLASGAGGVFVAKREIAGWPLIGLISRGMGTIFVNRDSHRDIPRVLARIEATLADGDGVILFPEGTSTPGEEVAVFRPSLLEAPARGRLPVSYAALGYSTDEGEAPARTRVCWWGDMSLVPHVWRLAKLRRLGARVAFGEGALVEEERKILAAELQRKVSELFVPVD